MKICCNYNNYSTFSPSYKAITDINRTQPVQPQALQPQPLIPVEAKEESRVNYNWKTVAIVAGVSALALLGIAFSWAVCRNLLHTALGMILSVQIVLFLLSSFSLLHPLLFLRKAHRFVLKHFFYLLSNFSVFNRKLTK